MKSEGVKSEGEGVKGDNVLPLVHKMHHLLGSVARGVQTH